MPEFIRPQRAIIETGGDGGLLVLIAVIAFVCMLAVAAWVLAHAVVLAAGLAVFVVALGGFCVWCRWAASPRRLAEVRAAESLPRPAAPLAVQRAIRGQQAIAPARHLHIHLHGLAEPDAAAVLRQALGDTGHHGGNYPEE